jgi:cell wall-associated NlpC family hydrolase
MHKLALILVLLCCLSSCRSTRSINQASKYTHQETTVSAHPVLADAVVKHARAYNGVRYRYGGTTHKGMDCSGLVWTAFKKENLLLPRISGDMAKKGRPIALKDIKKGDLLFFQTTTSNGVITSTLQEPYWNNAFKEARRIL